MSEITEDDIRRIVREEVTSLTEWTDDQKERYSAIMEDLTMKRMLRRSRASGLWWNTDDDNWKTDG